MRARMAAQLSFIRADLSSFIEWLCEYNSITRLAIWRLNKNIPLLNPTHNQHILIRWSIILLWSTLGLGVTYSAVILESISQHTMTNHDKNANDDLPSAAISSVQNAVGRGLVRRARRERALGRNNVNSIPASSSEIVVTSRQRKAGSTSLSTSSLPSQVIPRGDSESEEEESNDEWEEHVDVDERTAKHAVKSAQKAAEKRAAAERRAAAAAEKKSSANETPVAPDPEQVTAAAKKAAREFSARERARCARLFDAHMTLLLAALVRMDRAADSTELQALAISTAPSDALPSDSTAPREALARFALWSRTQFRVSPLFPTAKRTRPASQMMRSIRALSVHHAHVLDLAVLLSAALRADGTRARIVVPIRPYRFTPRKPPASLTRNRKAKTKTATDKKVIVSGDTARVARATEVEDKMRAQGADLYAWLEVWSEDDNCWLILDFIVGIVDVAKKMQIVPNMRDHAREILRRSQAYAEDEAALRTKSKSNSQSSSKRTKKQRDSLDEMVKAIDASWLARIVAIEHGIITDVTRRYVSKWKQVEKERGRGRPLEKYIEELSKPIPKSDRAAKQEERYFDLLAAKDDMPTSVAALHKHPRYVLERHLKKYETVHPRKPIGYLKEEPIYLRSCVHLLHSRERWERKMRKVHADAEPLKHVKSVLRDSDVKTPLFGEWQTDPLVIQPVVDGKIPRNERGNVELWTSEHLPAGGVHVNSRYAMSAARALSVDYAQAMTGFDVRGGRSVPRIEGVVVATEFAEAVRAAAAEKERMAFERAEAKAREEACARWKALLKAMVAREKVRRKYGGLVDEEGTYIQVQKRKGEKRAREEKALEERRRKRGSSSGTLHFEKDNAENGNSSRVNSSEDMEIEDAKAQDRGSTAKVHKHEFVEELVPHDEDGEVWIKKCRTCGMSVQFDKL